MEKKIVQSEALKILQKELLNASTKEEVIAIANKIRNINNKDNETNT